MTSENAEIILFFGALAAIGNWAAWEKGFFRLPLYEKSLCPPVRFVTVLGCFAIYLTSALVIAPLLARLFVALDHLQPSFGVNPSLSTMGWVQLVTICLAVVFIALFCLTQNLMTIKQVWKDTSRPHPKPVSRDFGLGVLCWLFSFPLVVAIGEICDTVVNALMGKQAYEQVAVRYLKMTLETPTMLVVALVTIVIVAPIIEEFLFRGMVQNWLKQHIGTKAAILASALCFALFHLAPSQGFGNISLVISLFTFACYLGFIYERQGSLFASIGLHMTFNTISCLRILLTP